MDTSPQNKLPRIVIKYNRLLDPVFLAYVRYDTDPMVEKWREKWSPWSEEKIQGQIQMYSHEWSLVEKDVLSGITESLGLEFLRNIITVHVVSATPRNLSQPIVMRGTMQPLHFIEALSHELVHEICTYEFDGVVGKRTGYFDLLRKIALGEQEKTVLNHMLVYAVLKYVFTDKMERSDLFSITIEKGKYPGYSEAMSLMDSIGYQEVLRQFREKI